MWRKRYKYRVAGLIGCGALGLALVLAPSSAGSPDRHLSGQEEQDVQQALSAQQDISIEFLQGPNHRAAGASPDTDMITPDEAVADAQDALGFLSGQSASAALVSFTDDSYGPEVIEPGSDEGVVEDPLYSDLTCYAITFSNVSEPLYGLGAGRTQGSSGVAFVDAYTGTVYEFATIDLTP